MICEEKKCTGCFACANICPKNCIKMCEDKFGHYHPKIDVNLCINCNMCVKVCPVNNRVERNRPLEAIAAWDKNARNRLSSTSGGIASLLSKTFIENNGVVYGAAFDKLENEFVRHIRVTELDELKKLRGSKYTHSHINDSYKKAKEDLDNHNKVLFIGTPCQGAGLRNYLKKDYKNLLIVDIVCHGVPSQKMLYDEMKRNNILNIDCIKFRDDKGYNISFFYKDNCLKSVPYYESLYFQSFLNGLNCRESCYSCDYACSDRVGDITLGDFWGLGKLEKYNKEEEKGISLILLNTEKGQSLFENIKEKIDFEIRTVDEAISGNTQLRRPTMPGNDSQLFRDEYLRSNDFEKAYLKSLHFNSMKNKLKRTVLRSKFLMKLIMIIKGEK